MTYAIETFALTKQYPRTQGWRGLVSRSQSAPPAVNGVNLSVREGELFGLLGPNGAGKTTLIKMLSTLILPTMGTASVMGYDLGDEIDIKASIGLVTSDERSFYWRLSGRQNLEFFAALHGLHPNLIQGQVDEVLANVGLEEVAERRFQTYSTGMRQRLSIARALLNKPRLLFLDEPTKGLDPIATSKLHDLIRGQLTDRQNLTVFLTTHHLEEAQKLCDRIAIMNQGYILALGSLAELRRDLDLTERYQIRVRGFNSKLHNNLTARFNTLQVNPSDTQETVLSIDVQDGNEVLDDAVDILRGGSASLQAVCLEQPSLETIFSHLVEETGEIEEIHRDPTMIDQRRGGQVQRPQMTLSHLSIISLLLKVLAFLKRDLYTEASYRFSFILQLLGIFFSVGVYYFLSKLLGEAVSPYLEAYGGDYFSFVIIGIAFAGYFGVGLSSFSNSLRQAQITGTLEAMLTTPTSVSTIILSSSLWNYLLTTLKVFVFLAVGAVFLGVDLGQGNYLAAILILVLTIIAFSSMGVLAASFIMVLKRGDPITWAFGALSSLLGGVYYPIAVLPDWMQWLSKLLPITYALEAMRLALLQGASFSILMPDILALGIFSVILLPVSLFAFRYAVRQAKVDGSLTHY